MTHNRLDNIYRFNNSKDIYNNKNRLSINILDSCKLNKVLLLIFWNFMFSNKYLVLLIIFHEFANFWFKAFIKGIWWCLSSIEKLEYGNLKLWIDLGILK